jgi:hypothetical protein
MRSSARSARPWRRRVPRERSAPLAWPAGSSAFSAAFSSSSRASPYGVCVTRRPATSACPAGRWAQAQCSGGSLAQGSAGRLVPGRRVSLTRGPGDHPTREALGLSPGPRAPRGADDSSGGSSRRPRGHLHKHPRPARPQAEKPRSSGSAWRPAAIPPAWLPTISAVPARTSAVSPTGWFRRRGFRTRRSRGRARR